MTADLLSAVLFTPDSIQMPIAWLGHAPFASWVIGEVSPEIFVELGTHTGNSYFSFCQTVHEKGLATKCYAVDTWKGEEHSETYGEEVFERVHSHNGQSYQKFSNLLRMTFDEALPFFADESIGLLHIDGLHTYEAVCHDFHSWLPKLAPGAVVLLHDTQVHEHDFGVWKLWEELINRYPGHLEFVHSYGLGVIQLNNGPEDQQYEWLKARYDDRQKLINYFKVLGSRLEEHYQLQIARRHADDLNEKVAELDCILAERDRLVAQYERQTVDLNRLVSEREKQIAALYQSKSWQITRPMRFIGSWLKQYGTHHLRTRT